MDRALAVARAAQADAAWSVIAASVTAVAGTPITADAARNRFKRLREIEDIEANRPVVPEGEAAFDLPEPEDGFVGLRMAFFDIEATALSAIMGRLLCMSVADNWGNVVTRRVTDFPQKSILDDSGLAEWCRDEIEKYDMAVGWYATGYDIGMLNARLLRWGLRPIRSDLIVNDPIYKARGGRYGAKIGSSKLDNVAKFFRLPVQKTEIDWDTWALAGTGDDAAMDEVVEHCEADVLVLRLAWNHLKPLIHAYHR